MKTKWKRWLAGSTLAVALAASATAWSMGHGGGMDHDPARMIAHMTDRLDLSTEQQASVETLLTSAQQANAADRERLKVLRGEMMGLRTDFDSGKAQQMSDEIGQITARMVFEASKTWSGIYQTLNAEQQAELDELMKKREAHRGKRRKDGGPAPQ